jgi:alditol oxidase
MGATLADAPRHPVPGMSPLTSTEQMGVAGPWNERLPHFRLGYTPSSGAELQSEYFVARRDVVPALAAVRRVADRMAPVLQSAEVRSVAADELWMSPAYRRDSVALHFTWTPDLQAVRPVVVALEAQLAPLGAKPHWGKVFTTAPQDVRAMYPRSADFRRLRHHYDPEGKFGNDLMDAYLPALGAAGG